MKDYFLFPNSGSSIKIEKSILGFTVGLVNINKITLNPCFTKDKLILELTELLEHIKKYG